MKYRQSSYYEKNNQKYLRAKVSKTPYKENLEDVLNILSTNLLAKESCQYETIITPRDCSKHGTFSYNPSCINAQTGNYYDVSVELVCVDDGAEGGGDYIDFGEPDDPSSGGSGGSSNGGGATSPIIPCEDEIHGCDKIAKQIADRLSVDSSLLNNLPESTLNKLDEIATLKENLSVVIDSPSFAPLNDSWFKMLREFAKRLEQVKDIISKDLYDALTVQLDHNLRNALNRVAKQLSVRANITDEIKKEQEFMYSGKDGVAILLYEFANGTGKDERTFSFDSDMTKQMLAGNVINDIKADFNEKIAKKGLTFDQFVANGIKEDGNYSFSPDHTWVVDSFNKHVNANWVQFFIGGANTKYYPSSDTGFIIVELTNSTSRNSLLLHVGNEYKRDGTGFNRPLSTIKQTFKFKLKIQ